MRKSTAGNANALEELVKDPAIQIRKVDDKILQELGKISGEVLSESSRKDDLARRVYASFIKVPHSSRSLGGHF